MFKFFIIPYDHPIFKWIVINEQGDNYGAFNLKSDAQQEADWLNRIKLTAPEFQGQTTIPEEEE